MSSIDIEERRRTHLVVLGLDVVSYSVEFDQTQERMVTLLGEIIRDATDRDSSPPEVFPTGDGALVAFEGRPVADAIDLARLVRNEIRDKLLRLPLRMAIHSGQGLRVRDAAGRDNYVGAVLNLTQRVLDIGDDEHLLLSEAAAAEVLNDATLASHIRRLSSNPVTVKHGVEMEIFNYVSDELGNASEPERATRRSEVTYAQMGRRSTWEELFQPSPLIRIIDLSLPIIGTPALVDHLHQLLRSGEAEVRIVLLDPFSCAARLRRTAPAYKAVNELETTIAYAVKILKGLQRGLVPHGAYVLERYDVRLTAAFPPFSAVIHPQRAYISIYMHHLTASRSPFFEIVTDHRLGEGSIVAAIAASFDECWRESISIFDENAAERLVARRHAVDGEGTGVALADYIALIGDLE